MSDTSGDGNTDDDDLAYLTRLQRRTWGAAVPYLAGALLAWVGAGFADYWLTEAHAQATQLGERAFLVVLTQGLLYAGAGLFIVGLLVAALRQHEHWRRDSGWSLGEPLDLDADDAEES